MSTTPKLPIDLAPSPGFCVKSHTATEAYLPHTTPNKLEPTAVPPGRKVFVNICYDKNVPPPPPADEDTIKRAINDEDPDDHSYYVPVVVSEPRKDKDKAGNPALIFDCVYNSSVRSRALRDSTFKIFLVELALQRIEAQTSLVLSRTIGTPNITAKGKLEPRTVWVPSWLAVGNQNQNQNQNESKAQPDEVTGGIKESRKGKRLIEEVNGTGTATDTALPKLRGILKQGGSRKMKTGTEIETQTQAQKVVNLDSNDIPITPKSQKPTWRWKKEDDGRLLVVVDVPKKIPREVIEGAELDIEPRRIVLNIPSSTSVSTSIKSPTPTPPFDLDIDLNKSDAEIVASASGPVLGVGLQVQMGDGNDGLENGNEEMREPNCTLLLKRQRDFDVENAEASWRIEDGRLEIWV